MMHDAFSGGFSSNVQACVQAVSMLLVVILPQRCFFQTPEDACSRESFSIVCNPLSVSHEAASSWWRNCVSEEPWLAICCARRMSEGRQTGWGGSAIFFMSISWTMSARLHRTFPLSAAYFSCSLDSGENTLPSCLSEVWWSSPKSC